MNIFFQWAVYGINFFYFCCDLSKLVKMLLYRLKYWDYGKTITNTVTIVIIGVCFTMGLCRVFHWCLSVQFIKMVKKTNMTRCLHRPLTRELTGFFLLCSALAKFQLWQWETLINFNTKMLSELFLSQVLGDISNFHIWKYKYHKGYFFFENLFSFKSYVKIVWIKYLSHTHTQSN